MNPVFAPVLGGIFSTIGDLIDDLHTSDKEKLDAQIELQKLGIETAKIEAGLIQGQIEVNKVEAQHSNLLVAGARPAILWVGAIAMAWTYIAHPMLVWGWALLQANDLIPAGLEPPPTLEAEALWVIVSGILGLGGFRTFEKTKGVAR